MTDPARHPWVALTATSPWTPIVVGLGVGIGAVLLWLLLVWAMGGGDNV